MRKLLGLALCFAFVASTAPFTAIVSAQAYDPCFACKPMRNYQSEPSGSYNVCIGSGFTPAEIAGMKAGVNYWNDYFAGSNINDVRLNPEATSNCDITIGQDSGMTGLTLIGESNTTSDARGASIDVNPDYTNNTRSQNFWTWNIAHEMGHILGWSNVGSTTQVDNCSANTVMRAFLPDNVGALSSPPLCADRKAVEQRYRNDDPSGSDDETHTGENYQNGEQQWFVCDVHWIIEDHYIWTSNGWELEYTLMYVDYVDNCIPLL
jgi:hypothetical protein